MKIQSFIKWSGSKRSQAPKIISLFPENIDTYYEPFLGSGSILGHYKPKKAICGDIYKPLVDLWSLIQEKPNEVISDYSKKWNKLKENYTFFYDTREKFNKNNNPLDLLLLSRTCVNGLMRFNLKGEFNNSLHHTRPGMNPEKLRKIIMTWSVIIKNHKFISSDYREITKDAKKGDFVYLDPPYFHTKTMYVSKIDYSDFIGYLEDLNKKGVLFALSYDGARGNKEYKTEIPKTLYKRKLLIKSGNSPFIKLQDKKSEMVYESLYLNY